MISVAAIRMQQFGVTFYQASLSAKDIDKLVRFEVLSYGEQAQGVRGGRKKAAPASKVNWDLLERRIAANEKAYQRQIIRKKIDELVQYYEQCRQARDLPSIPGAVIISCDEPLKFEPAEAGASIGTLKVPEREGILRAIDGQHRLLALHADRERFEGEDFTRPGGDLRPAPRRPRRPDVRHDQRQAHAAERVAPRLALRTAALCGREPRGRARRRPGAERSRGLAALRRDQAARRRQGTHRAGAARAGAEAAVRVGRIRRRAARATPSAKSPRSSSSTT